MRAKRIKDEPEQTYVLVFDKGDEAMRGLLAFAKEHRLTAGHFTAIGAFSDVALGYFDRDRKDYTQIPLAEQVEVLSLIGDIALDAGEPKIHAHVVVGRSDGTVRGGHLLAGHVWPTLEVVLEQAAKPLRRTSDRETGLALLQL
jgi:predicted DNA-binding protein with PD1-like motif